ncbi:MAG: T9SS type A sorting domain-containing protein, partial [Saprospiraceae bacterium]|nr:T9SS type A sorting domain-containing protein [Saprospiraceae bacterium]
IHPQFKQNLFIMEISKQLIALISTFLITITSLSASNATLELHEYVTQEEYCNLPAPDSFNIISRSYDLIELVWVPISVDVTHTLEVYTKLDSSSAWELYDTYSDLSSNSFSLNGVGLDSYCRFVLATNCSTGEPSELNTILELDKIIIEVTVPGRIPINPTPINCSQINLNNYEWVGFGVSENIIGSSKSGVEHYFEFTKVGDDRVQIRRVLTEGEVVACNNGHFYPRFSGQIIYVSYPFLITKILPNQMFFDIGRVGITLHGKDPIVDICVVPLFPKWNSDFNFEVLVADEVAKEITPHIVDDRNLSQLDLKNINKFSITNPFSDNLIIFLSEASNNFTPPEVSIVDINGQVLFDKFIPIIDNKITINVLGIPDGIYFIKIKNNFINKTLKGLKVSK